MLSLCLLYMQAGWSQSNSVDPFPDLDLSTETSHLIYASSIATPSPGGEGEFTAASSSGCAVGEAEVIITLFPAIFGVVDKYWTLTEVSSGDTIASTFCGDYLDGLGSIDTFCLDLDETYEFNAFSADGFAWLEAYEIKSDFCYYRFSVPSDGLFPSGMTCPGTLEESFQFSPLLNCPDIETFYDPGICGAMVAYDVPGCDGVAVSLISGTEQTRAFAPATVLTATANGAQDVFAADLDNDGDRDIISSSQTDDRIIWYENTGGAFGPPNEISALADLARGVFAADLDNDGDQDVLSSSINDDKVAWYENLGGGSFGAQSVISASADGATDVATTDVDGDGDYDVIGTSFNDNKVAWYENLGGGSFGPEQIISSTSTGAVSVVVADFNGDSQPDLLVASAGINTVAWYENLGGGSFSAANVISASISAARSAVAADFDFDGDMDVACLSPSANTVYWFENVAGVFGAPQTIATLTDPFDAYPADLNRDGYVDLVVSSKNGNKVVWYKNVNTVFAPEEPVSGSVNGARGVYVADFDGNTYADVVTTSNTDDEVAVAFNQVVPEYFAGGVFPQTYELRTLDGSISSCTFNVIVDTAGLVVNDLCNCAAIATAGVTSFCSENVTPGSTSSCTFNDINDLWFTYNVPSGLDTLRINTCGSDFDTGLSLWDNCFGSEIACNDDGDFGGGSSCDGAAFQSLIVLSGSSLNDLVGQDILIRISGWNAEKGCGDLVIEEIASPACDPTVAPANFVATSNASQIVFSWDPVPGSIGCSLEAGPLGSGFPFNQILPGPDVSGVSLPISAAPTGNYQARVRCACSVSPLALTPYSNVDLFAISGAKFGTFGEMEISVFPNPATNSISVKSTSLVELPVRTVEIVDLVGAVHLVSVTGASLSSGFDLDVSDLANGVYFLRVQTETDVISQQFQIQR